MDTIKVGDTWKCIKTIQMENSGEIAYLFGNCYKCEVQGCLTDEQGHKKHKISGPKYIAYHFEKVTKNTYAHFKPGQVLVRILEGKDSTWLLRKDKPGFLRVKSDSGEPAWCTFTLAIDDYDTYELASESQISWFEHCEKTKAYISFNEFINLKANPLSYFGEVASTVDLPTSKLGFQPGDKVEFYRQPEEFEWEDIGEVPINFYIGQVLEVRYHSLSRGSLSVVEHGACVYPAGCFRKVGTSSTSYPEIEPTPLDELFYPFRIGDKVYFQSKWEGHELGLKFDSHFKLDETTTFKVTAIRMDGEYIRLNNGCTVGAKYLKKVEDYPRWVKSGFFFYYYIKPGFYSIRVDEEFKVNFRCKQEAGVVRAMLDEIPITPYELVMLNQIPLYIDTEGELNVPLFHPFDKDPLTNKGLWQQMENLDERRMALFGAFSSVPYDSLVEKNDLPDLHKTEKSATFDTEIERVKDLSDVKLFKPSKNRYS